MKFKFLKGALLSLFVVVNGLANAGLIVDTTNSTFIDKTTGLEWMDFGINDHHTYNEIASLLDTTYSGWSLASESQVLTMWHNAFAGKGSLPDEVFSNGDKYVSYRNIERSNTTFRDIFAKMGFSNGNGLSSVGWFTDSNGGLSYAAFICPSSNCTIQTAFVNGRGKDYDVWRNISNSDYSTMLVREQTVPEPSTLAIFALGVIGLASRRFKKQS